MNDALPEVTLADIIRQGRDSHIHRSRWNCGTALRFDEHVANSYAVTIGQDLVTDPVTVDESPVLAIQILHHEIAAIIDEY